MAEVAGACKRRARNDRACLGHSGRVGFSAVNSGCEDPDPSKLVEPQQLGEPTERYRQVRELTERLAEPLSPEDQTVQSMADTSPTKWHRAHTTWFFETFLLSDRDSYKPVRPGLPVPVQLLLRGGGSPTLARREGPAVTSGVQ